MDGNEKNLFLNYVRRIQDNKDCRNNDLYTIVEKLICQIEMDKKKFHMQTTFKPTHIKISPRLGKEFYNYCELKFKRDLRTICGLYIIIDWQETNYSICHIDNKDIIEVL